MLSMLINDERFSVVAIVDRDAARMQTLSETYSDIQIASDAKALVSRDDIDLVYIATPPSSHVEYASLAIDHNKAVLCEKPLAVDIGEASQLVRKAQTSGLPNAVNFTGASSQVLEIIENAIKSGKTGKPLRVEIRCHFSQWPRQWQQGATSWLAGRGEGGFVREVISHFIYQTQRLIGDIEVLSSVVDYPDEQSSESHVMAAMRCDGIPVKLFGGTGGNAPDVVEWVLYATKKSYRLLNWRQLQEGTDEGWVDVEVEETPTPSRHLTAISNMLIGEAHPLSDFAMGLKVQQTIETILAV
jgi:predicted dehydrogenase